MMIKMEYCWECQRCGRKELYKFGLHSSSKIADDCCVGKVRRIKLKNMW